MSNIDWKIIHFSLLSGLVSCVFSLVMIPVSAWTTWNQQEQEHKRQEQEQAQKKVECEDAEEEERVIEVLNDNHPAVKISAIRNYRKKTWLHCLEIEVTNISNKPIYYLNLGLSFPEMRRGDAPIGDYFRFGSFNGGLFAHQPKPEDPSIKPGEKYVFRFQKDRIEVYEQMAKYGDFDHSVTKRLELEIELISFGDGTGFMNSEEYFWHQNGVAQTRKLNTKAKKSW